MKKSNNCYQFFPPPPPSGIWQLKFDSDYCLFAGMTEKHKKKTKQNKIVRNIYDSFK